MCVFCFGQHVEIQDPYKISSDEMAQRLSSSTAALPPGYHDNGLEGLHPNTPNRLRHLIYRIVNTPCLICFSPFVAVPPARFPMLLWNRLFGGLFRFEFWCDVRTYKHSDFKEGEQYRLKVNVDTYCFRTMLRVSADQARLLVCRVYIVPEQAIP